MTLVVKCVICGIPIEHPKMNQSICGGDSCKRNYQVYLVRKNRQKAKDYKLLKIKKDKRIKTK